HLEQRAGNPERGRHQDEPAKVAPEEAALCARLFQSTLSASRSSERGMRTPSLLAAFELIASSKRLGRTTGISEGGMPSRIRRTWRAKIRSGSSMTASYDINPPASTRRV